ncbi:amidohydrolase family protein [Streptosporangium vulgare]|uniref:amidohydrolase family protein n=1 Tax=Streptosporangium vulgare TaxID=46190 RepID=UPI00337BCB4B
MNVDELVAIDVHTHAEVSADGHASLGDELAGASAKYFKGHSRPTVPEMAAYYRERGMAAVVFTVDAEHATGHPRISNEEVAASCAAHADVLIPFASVDPWKGRAGVREARRLVAEHGVRGFKFHPSVQGMAPDDRAAYPLYEAIEEMGVPALFHTGQTGIGAGLPGGGGIRLKYSNPMLVDDVAVDFPELRIILAHTVLPLAGRGSGGRHAQAVRLHRPVRMVAEVLPPAARPVRQHAAEGQGALRVRLPDDHAGPVARRLRRPRHQTRGPPEDPQGQRRPPARAHLLISGKVLTSVTNVPNLRASKRSSSLSD